MDANANPMMIELVTFKCDITFIHELAQNKGINEVTRYILQLV